MIAEYHRVAGELRRCPFLSHVPTQKTTSEKHTGEQQNNAAIKNEPNILPELDDATFRQILAEMEDYVYSLDGEQMLAALAKLQEYQYCGTALAEKLKPIRKKIEMSDYMPAFDALSDIWHSLTNKTEGGSANA